MKHTAEQIRESIKYWQKVLEDMEAAKQDSANKELAGKLDKLQSMVDKAVSSGKVKQNEKVKNDLADLQKALKTNDLKEADSMLKTANTVANVMVVDSLVDTLMDILSSVLGS